MLERDGDAEMKPNYERDESIARAFVVMILFVLATMGWMVFALRIVHYVESQQAIEEQHRALMDELQMMEFKDE
jgi:hypothetical protein